jgi:hypothetical protein
MTMAHYTEQWQITTEAALRAVEGAVQQAVKLGIKLMLRCVMLAERKWRFCA